jgi:hypothetical protein
VEILYKQTLLFINCLCLLCDWEVHPFCIETVRSCEVMILVFYGLGWVWTCFLHFIFLISSSLFLLDEGLVSPLFLGAAIGGYFYVIFFLFLFLHCCTPISVLFLFWGLIHHVLSFCSVGDIVPFINSYIYLPFKITSF